MTVTITFMDDVAQVECAKFSILEGRLVLRNAEDKIIYVANADRWLSFDVDRGDDVENGS